MPDFSDSSPLVHSTLLVIDDDRVVRHTVRYAFKDQAFNILEAATGEEGLELLRSERPDVLLLDIVLPRTSGLEVLRQVKELNPNLPVIFITAGGTSDSAIDAMMLGAFDYMLKPIDVSKLRAVVTQALETRRMMQSPVEIHATEGQNSAPVQLVGRSPAMVEVYKAIARVAPQDVSVLIRGESGTGKELVARAIFQHSARRDGPFLAVNCAAMTDTLLESELFGHEKGSFTGADRRRIGKFEQCHGGTIFLDEVGDMSPLVQSKVLRLLQEQKFERVGGNETIQTDVRIITATNRGLERMESDGKFRTDLYFRLNGFTISLPPLRERQHDIPLLLEHFLARFRDELRKTEVTGITADAAELMMSYRWPGNVRELQSVLRQSLLRSTGSVIVPDFLPDTLRADREFQEVEPHACNGMASDLAEFIEARLLAGSTELYTETVDRLERYLWTRVLQETGGNQSKAALILGCTRGKIRDRIAAFGISLANSVQVPDDGVSVIR